jgi:hypothetical protein
VFAFEMLCPVVVSIRLLALSAEMPTEKSSAIAAAP